MDKRVLAWLLPLIWAGLAAPVVVGCGRSWVYEAATPGGGTTGSSSSGTGSTSGGSTSSATPRGTSSGSGSTSSGTSGTGSTSGSSSGSGSTSSGSSSGSTGGTSSGGSSSGSLNDSLVSTVGLAGVIAAGGGESCALVLGGVQCWGENSEGQLGDDFTAPSAVPQPVFGLDTSGAGVQAVAAGFAHACALVNGGVSCWGDNISGDLGYGQPFGIASNEPVSVTGLWSAGSGVQALTAGSVHSCALVNGGVSCWGDDSYGQLGNDSTEESDVPAQVQGLGSPGSGVQAVAAGAFYTCALVNGGVQCWGDNSYGQLGDGSDAGSDVPVPVQGLGSGILAIAAGDDHACAVVSGGVWCWGNNGDGELGDDSYADSPVPVAVQGLGGPGSGVVALAAGSAHTCALANGGLQCWGWNLSGQLGTGSTTLSKVPVAVAGLGSPGSGVQVVAAADYHTCALVNGGVQCWGDNVWGDVGNGSMAQSDVPAAVVGLNGGIQALAAGDADSCALVNGGVQCWGDNSYGQLGDAPDAGSLVPVAIPGVGSGVEAIAVGFGHVCALLGGGVWCWGLDSAGQLGNNSMSNSPAPVAVQGLSNGVQAIAAGDYFTCALVSGGVQCWGDNALGDLGDNSTSSSLVPVAVQGLGPGSGVQAIGAGYYHACALVNGGVQCWGDNDEGELGNDSTLQSPVPVPVQGLGSGVQALTVGAYHACALVGGAAWCWGDDADGQLGNNSTANSPVPVAVVGLGSPSSGVQALAAGGAHTCALVGGGVQCWGFNPSGQLGNNSTANSPVPVAAQGLGSGVQAVVAGANHTCALLGGAVRCWGDDNSGQLGNDSTTQSNVPALVSPWDL